MRMTFRMRSFGPLAACALAVGLVTSRSAARGEDFNTPTNLVHNGSFEAGDSGWSFGANGAHSTGTTTTNEAFRGAHSFMLANASGQAPHVYGRLAQTVTGLQPFTTYRISCWAKGRDAGIVWIGGGPGWYLRAPFPKGTFGWTNVVTEYQTDDSPADFDLMVLTESETAAVWIDDIRMEAVRADTAARDKALAAWTNQLGTARKRLETLRARASDAAQNDARVQLGFNVAERFLRRIETGGPQHNQSLVWSRLQGSEVLRVLDETERQINRASRQKTSGAQPWPVTDKTEFRNGLLGTRVTGGGWQPFWYYGYGHFNQVIEDLPNFPGLGASIVQDGRMGPSGMNADGTFGPGLKALLEGLARAERCGMRVDWLLSPHYFPDWAFAQAPGVRGGGPGFIGFNIDHPVARKVLADFAAKVSAPLSNEPALLTVCLSNEPVYDQSGRDPESRPAWIAWLKQTHGDLASLNSLYGTSYTNFEAVPTPAIGLKATVPENRAYYDWVRFNQAHFAEWHAWLRSVLKRNLPATPTHAKIMVFFCLDRDKLHYGVDPELFCDATDLAGCDAYAFPQGPTTYDWMGQEFFYDLLHSFRGQPVFNSENHIIPDGSPPTHVAMAMTRAQFWQGGLHHQALTTTWVWEEPVDGSLAGSVYFRPANVYGAGRAMLDLNSCAREVAAINQEKPRVALLYSPASAFWEPSYKDTIMSLYRQLSCLGEPVTFVSEKQLAANRKLPMDWIILPNATHATDDTVAALDAFLRAGGHLLSTGTNNLAWDQYHRPRPLPTRIQQAPVFASGPDENSASRELRARLVAAGLSMPQLIDAATGLPAWGIEFRTARVGGNTVVSAINHTAAPLSVRAPMIASRGAVDLLSDELVPTDNVRLEPMVPRLLKSR
jgi:hypothetical protein